MKDIIKNIEALRYYIIKDGGILHLYDLDRECKRSNYCYVASVSVTASKKVMLNGKVVELDDLRKEIDKYVEGLEFPCDTYDPSYNEDYRLELRASLYMKSLGFEHKYLSRGDSYKLLSYYGRLLSKVDVLFDKKVIFYPIKGEDVFVEKHFTDIESFKKAVNGIVHADLLGMGVMIADTLKRTADGDYDATVIKQKSLLDFEKESFREMLKEDLEKMRNIIVC